MVILNGSDLNLISLIKISRGHEKVSLSEESIQSIIKASTYVQKLASESDAVYGINTGFGHLAHVKIEKSQVSELQINLLKSHACGVGEPLSIEVVRAMMALRINALVSGYSGISLETLEKLMELLNKNVIPVVLEKGSLGASGDLSPLSHMSLPLLGLGEVFYEGIRMPAKEGLEKAGILPLERLKAKEGLSLINGTQGMSAIGSLLFYDAEKLIKVAHAALALTMEALGGIKDAFDDEIHLIRKQKGQIQSASWIRALLKGSTYVTRQNELRVQDAYSIRCAPQVLGASLSAFAHIKEVIENEMNAVTDNPLIFVDEEKAISAGNFHGEPIAMAFDYFGIACAEIANISERRIERLVNPHLNKPLPPFLAKWSGLHSGYMIMQYTAAALVSENKVLAHPASVDSIPSSGNQEDHVSMGSISVRKAKTILENTRKVIAIELLTACQAIDFREQKKLSPITQKIYEKIRERVPFIEQDEIMYPYIELVDMLIKDEVFDPWLEI